MNARLLKEMVTQLPQIALVLANIPFTGCFISEEKKNVLHLTDLQVSENDFT